MTFMNTLIVLLHIFHHLFELWYYKYYTVTKIFKGEFIMTKTKKIDEKFISKLFRSNTIRSEIAKD